MPLVIALHGGGGTGERMERLSLGGFNTLADKEGFVVVYPDGIERHWNDGRGKVRYRAHREKIDDVGFMSALIDELVKRQNIDDKRVYITGISNGAMLSNRLGCELTGKIAAIAPVAGNMPYDLAPQCSPSEPISVLMISGTEDPMMPWEGGEARFNRSKFGRVLSAAETIKFWVANNRCIPRPVITWEPDKDPQDGTRVRKEAYGGCRKGTEVILYAIEGGGHAWPGGFQYLPERVIGRTSEDIDANDVVWNFFKLGMP
jgi:polyhydroxybutyrate depolymerase